MISKKQMSFAATTLSLLLCLCFTAMMVVGIYFGGGALFSAPIKGGFRIGVHGPYIAIFNYSFPNTFSHSVIGREGDKIAQWRFMGIDYLHQGPWPRGDWISCSLPLLYPVLLTAIWPANSLWKYRRQRKAARIGLCPKCNYDLRTQHAGSGGAVCPECGTPVAGVKVKG